jgi:hypothetical protein
VLAGVVLAVVPLFGGDSLWGKVAEVRSAELVVLDYGKGLYVIRIVGSRRREGALSEAARDLVAKLVLGRNARMRLEGRNKADEMVARLFYR